LLGKGATDSRAAARDENGVSCKFHELFLYGRRKLDGAGEGEGAEEFPAQRGWDGALILAKLLG
jgi:hypothetical protein